MERLDLVGDLLSEHVAQRAADVVLGRERIDARELVVDAHVSKARVHQREADRAAAKTASRTASDSCACRRAASASRYSRALSTASESS